MPVRALARVNLAAIERNVGRLRDGLTAGASLCAVVKADGYGHGALECARAARAGGAGWLAVATAGEGRELRAAGIDGPILVMGALSSEELAVAVAAGADLTAWSEEFVAMASAASAAAAASAASAPEPVRLHVKLDSGMGRLGTRDVQEARRVAARVAGDERLHLVGVMTHFATADEDPEFVGEQLARFVPFVEEMRGLYPGVIVHAANSAAALFEPASHFDLVRCGIAIYGCDPRNDDPEALGLEPALTLSSYVAAVKLARAGDSAGYGREFVAAGETYIGTVPIGYGDGVRRALTNNCDVLVGGRRYPLIGRVSMDNITIDLGPDPVVSVGDAVTLIGLDGRERLTAEEMARRIGTINYEVTCGISARVPRVYHRDGAPA
jgi:alanine racemase